LSVKETAEKKDTGDTAARIQSRLGQPVEIREQHPLYLYQYEGAPFYATPLYGNLANFD
jgi:hypothetical protein